MKNNLNVLEMPIIDVSKAETAIKEAEIVLINAQAVIVKTPEQLQVAGDWRNRIKAKLKQLDTERKELTRPLDDVKAKITDKYRPAIEKLDIAYKLFDRGITGYLEEQERIRREQQRKLEAEAEKKRLEAEAKAKEWADKGNDKKAEEWLDKAENVIAPVVPEAPKAEGISTRKDWDFEIINPNEVPRDFCIPDEKAIRAFVKATKGTKPIAGIKIFEKTIVVTNNR